MSSGFFFVGGGEGQIQQRGNPNTLAQFSPALLHTSNATTSKGLRSKPLCMEFETMLSLYVVESAATTRSNAQLGHNHLQPGLWPHIRTGHGDSNFSNSLTVRISQMKLQDLISTSRDILSKGLSTGAEVSLKQALQYNAVQRKEEIEATHNSRLT